MLTYPPVKKVSVVIPVYNEQDSLPELLRRTDAACATLGRQYEILLIDDGSSDDSARMLTEAAEAEGSHVVAVLLNRNYGQHSAIMAGFSHVTGDLIITLDADLQNPPEEIPRLVAKADEGYDVVGTVRQNRQDSIFRKTASKMINRLIQRTTGKAMGDYGCMLRAYRRHIIDAMLNCHERSTFIPILANTFARRAVEIQKELNRIIDESRLNISMNPTPVIRDGKINVMLENVPANNYYLQADVYIYTDEETLDMQQVYQSGIIKQGFYIESGDVMEMPEGGRYNGIAVFHALYPETLEEIGQAAMNIVVTSE